jgi:type IV pilus assembly protein PilQ
MTTPRLAGLVLLLALAPTGTIAQTLPAQEAPIQDLPVLQPEQPAQEMEPKPIGSSEVRVSETMMVDIIVQNDYVTNALHKLAVQARRNIVPSPAVERLVSATIYDVTFYEALDALLRPNGLGFIEQGDFIYVYTGAELTALGLDEWRTITRVIHLDYLRAEDARDFVSHLLSSVGTIEVTKDLEVAGEQAGGQIAVGGIETGGEGEGEKVYTPNIDEFALSNSIVVHDYPVNVDRIEVFLRDADTQPAQVLIEASIVQTSLTEQNAFGVDFALLSGVNFTSFFNFPVGDIPLGIKLDTEPDDPGTGDLNLVSPDDRSFDNFVIANPGNAGAGDATIRGGYIDDDFGVFIRALDAVSDVTLLSNPKILTLNRQRARVYVGTRVGYLETTVVENQVLETIKWIDTGVILDIRPYILRDGRVRLELAPKVSEVKFREVESISGRLQQIPDEEIETVNADVLVPEGYTAVIGGLFREDTSRTRRQVPLLGDIPVAGAAFRGHDDEVRQVEIIFLIKPTVMRDRVIDQVGRRGEEFTEYVRVGAREGLLPWSRERKAARLNLEAQRFKADGKFYKALYRLRRSLELKPSQPELIRTRQELLGDPSWWPASFLDRVIFGDLEGGDVPGEPELEPEPDLEGEDGNDEP